MADYVEKHAEIVEGKVTEVDVGQLTRPQVAPELAEADKEHLAELTRISVRLGDPSSMAYDRHEPLGAAG